MSRGRHTRAPAALAQRAIAGIVPGDHVCASFGSDEEHRAIVARYARQALDRDELETEIAALEGRREQVRADLVRYEESTGSALVRAKDVKPFSIPIEHRE